MPRTSRRQIIKIAAAAAVILAFSKAPRAAETNRTLGKGGPVVSAVGLGCNNFGGRLDAAATERVVHAAVDLGITLFDTADVYSGGASEEYLGQAIVIIDRTHIEKRVELFPFEGWNIVERER